MGRDAAHDMTLGTCTNDPDFDLFLKRGDVDGDFFVRPKEVCTSSILKSSLLRLLRPRELPSLRLHLLMHVGGHSDMTPIRKRTLEVHPRRESSVATFDRVPSGL